MRIYHLTSCATLALCAALSSCSSTESNGPTGVTSIKINKVTAGGDFVMSGRLGLESGALTVTIAAIRDPDVPARPADPAKVSFGVTGAAGASLVCSIGKVSSTAKAAVDLVFINDTTGSMSGTVHGITDSVQEFAEDLTAGGVDARYSMYTYGDAYATKSASDTTFTIGKGDYTPPGFDTVQRPYVGLTELDTFKGFLAELSGCSCLGSGGGDSQENTLGTLKYADSKVAWRDGAARMFVAIGDNPSHQLGDHGPCVSPFEPPGGDALVANLSGNSVIHVVGQNRGSSPYYNLKTLADKTGGAFLALPSDGKVDLGKLELKQWLTTSFTGTCADPTGGTYSIVVTSSIVGTKTFVGTLTFEVELK